MFSSFLPCFSLLPCFCLFPLLPTVFLVFVPVSAVFPLFSTVFTVLICFILLSHACFSCFSRSLFSLAPLFLSVFYCFPVLFFCFLLFYPVFLDSPFFFCFTVFFSVWGLAPQNRGKTGENRKQVENSGKQRKIVKNFKQEQTREILLNTYQWK